jgi:ABC-type transporter Mla subunit MlaD
MTNQDFGDKNRAAGAARGREKTQIPTGPAGEAFASISDTAREAGAKAKETVSETASAVADHFKDILDKQIGNHISGAGVLASAVKRAADEIEQNSPLAAGFVRSVSDKVEQFVETYEDETVEQLVRSASDFARRQPALVFGLAAVAGFLVFRTIKSAPATTQSPPIQPSVGARV